MRRIQCREQKQETGKCGGKLKESDIPRKKIKEVFKDGGSDPEFQRLLSDQLIGGEGNNHCIYN